MKKRLVVAVLVLVPVLVLTGAWFGRTLALRFFPIHHSGVVQRIGVVQNLGTGGPMTRSFAILLEDGFVCESTLPAFAAVQKGDTVHLRGYHDVRGWPVMDPGWWRCTEAQLDGIETARTP
jgi:hypothetical protein